MINGNTHQFIIEHPELSAEEIVALAQADYSRDKKIDRKELAAYMLTRNLTTRMRVAMSQIPDNAPEQQLQLKYGIQKVLDLVFSGIDYVDTTKTEIASEVSTLLEAMTGVGILTEPEKA